MEFSKSHELQSKCQLVENLFARKAKGNNYLSSDGGSFNKGGLIPFTQNVYRGLLRSFLPFL